MKVFANLNSKDNRLPKKTTGIISKPKFRSVPISNPDVMVNNHPGIQRNLAQFNAIDPVKVRSQVRERLSSQVNAVNRQIAKSSLYKGLTFAVHEESGNSFVVVKNKKTGQVLKQIPSDVMLTRKATMLKASGLLKDITI